MWFTTCVRRSASSVSSEMSWLLVLLFLAVLDALPVDVACVRLADIYWNSSNPMFRIDNTDHIIDVNRNNEKYEFDQVNIICPGYPPGTHEDDSEKYIIYNVSKEEYDMCTITGPSPRIIAVCDKPHRVMYFTITFRPFTPQPGGLEFRPGQDYYFISTSSKENFFNRIGGRCLTHNMRVVFKVCCNTPNKITTPWMTTSTTTSYYDNRVHGNALSTPNVTTPTSLMSNTVRPRIIYPGPTFGPATPKFPTVIPRVYGGGGGGGGNGNGGIGFQTPTTTPDFKFGSIDGTGNGRGVKPGSNSKKAIGESKDKQHPNETGMKIELVRNGALSSSQNHRWSRTELLTVLLCPFLAITLVHLACR